MDKHILVIDDDLDILDMVTFILTEQGYAVTASPTGEETDKLTEHGYFVTASPTGEETDNLIENIPDLVLLDLTLHGTFRNGADICIKLKNSPLTQDLPVILVSGERDIQAVAANCGANDYIKKPFDIDDFTQKVNTYLL